MGTVVISAASYVVYGDEAGFDQYMQATLVASAQGAAWFAADATKRKQALVEATRMLDAEAWVGTPVGTPVIDVVLQWPRTGVTDESGVAVSSLTVPDRIVKACYELASWLLANPGLKAEAMSGSNVKRVKAGPVDIEFFTGTLGITGTFPVRVQDLIGFWLSGSGGGSASYSYGTDPEEESAQSQFDTNDTYDVNTPY